MESIRVMYLFPVHISRHQTQRGTGTNGPTDPPAVTGLPEINSRQIREKRECAVELYSAQTALIPRAVCSLACHTVLVRIRVV